MISARVRGKLFPPRISACLNLSPVRLGEIPERWLALLVLDIIWIVKRFSWSLPTRSEPWLFGHWLGSGLTLWWPYPCGAWVGTELGINPMRWLHHSLSFWLRNSQRTLVGSESSRSSRLRFSRMFSHTAAEIRNFFYLFSFYLYHGHCTRSSTTIMY